MVPSGCLTVCHGKSQFLTGKPSMNGPFSMAMLNNQMVNIPAPWFAYGIWLHWLQRYDGVYRRLVIFNELDPNRVLVVAGDVFFEPSQKFHIGVY